MVHTVVQHLGDCQQGAQSHSQLYRELEASQWSQRSLPQKYMSLVDRELNRQLRAYTARAEDPSAVASTRFPYHSWTSACNSSSRRSHTSGLMSAFGKRRQKDPEPEVSLSLLQTITTRIPAETSVDSFSSRWEPVKKRERPLGASQSKRKKKENGKI